jgi:hypothetical protein
MIEWRRYRFLAKNNILDTPHNALADIETLQAPIR